MRTDKHISTLWCTALPIFPLVPTVSPSFLTAKQPRPSCRLSFFPTRKMADESGSAHFQARFQSALEAYQKTTGVTLAESPVAVRLQNCDSVESITTLLLYEARAFSDFRGFDRITKAIQSTTSILSTLSATASLGHAIGIVRQKTLMECSRTLTVFLAILTGESNTGWPCYTTCCMCLSLDHIWVFL